MIGYNVLCMKYTLMFNWKSAMHTSVKGEISGVPEFWLLDFGNVVNIGLEFILKNGKFRVRFPYSSREIFNSQC